MAALHALLVPGVLVPEKALLWPYMPGPSGIRNHHVILTWNNEAERPPDVNSSRICFVVKLVNENVYSEDMNILGKTSTFITNGCSQNAARSNSYI